MNKKGSLTINQIIIALVVFVIVIILLMTYPKIYSGAKSIVDAAMGVAGEHENDATSSLSSSRELTIRSGTEEIKLKPVPTIEQETSTTDPTTGPVTEIPIPLTGKSISEKVASAAKEAGLLKSETELILKVVSQESQFRHCCLEAGKVRGYGSLKCNPTDEINCEPNKILNSGSSLGVMQLNKGAHPDWFETDEKKCSDPSYKLDCEIKSNVACMGSTGYNMDCNIRIGIKYLISLKGRYGKGITYPATCKTCRPNDDQDKSYYCEKKKYTGWDAALRAYNGLSCDKEQENYVEQINKRQLSPELQQIVDTLYS